MVAQQRHIVAQRETERRLKRAQVREIVVRELIGAPLVEGLVAPVNTPFLVHRALVTLQREQDGVGIAHHNGTSQRAHSGNDLTRLRAKRGDIAEADNTFDALSVDLRQHCFERRKVAMNIRENGDLLHAASLHFSTYGGFMLVAGAHNSRIVSSASSKGGSVCTTSSGVAGRATSRSRKKVG